MYRLWQRKHFPLHGFDEALDQIADIGRTNQLKVISSLSAHRRPPPGPFAPCLPQALAPPSMMALRPSKNAATHVQPHGICAGGRCTGGVDLQTCAGRYPGLRACFRLQVEMREMRQGVLKTLTDGQKEKEREQLQQEVGL